MLELIITVLALWLLIKAIGLALKITWGTTKIVASILITLAVIVFIFCLIFVGGFILLLPTALIAGVLGLLKSLD